MTMLKLSNTDLALKYKLYNRTLKQLLHVMRSSVDDEIYHRRFSSRRHYTFVSLETRPTQAPVITL